MAACRDYRRYLPTPRLLHSPPLPVPSTVSMTTNWKAAMGNYCWLLFIVLFASSTIAMPSSAAGPASWKQFRGDGGNGLALGAQPPVHWSDTRNVTWKTPIHGRGWSSPVVADGQIWMTTATEDGLQQFAVCVDLQTGAIVHDLLVFTNAEVQPDFHITNSYASPTPVIDGDYVYVHFGAYGTACLRRKDGSKVWERRDLPCNHYRGPGSSPMIYGDLLIFHMDGYDHQYAIALNKHTGETVWKKNREIDYGTDNGDFYKAFSTPILIQVDGQDQLVSPASKACVVLNPRTGGELWRVRYDEHSTTVRPVFDGVHLYLSTGFGKAKMICVRVDGHGDVTDTHVKWVQHKSIGSKPSPVLVEGRLFDVTDDGIIERIDTETGHIAWRERLGGKFSASLVATEKHLYAFDHDGAGYVFTVEDHPRLVARNELPHGCQASPAIVGNSLIVRTITNLYRFDDEDPQPE
ncbi:MAG: serine/threonine protein kinase [Pirellulaceae bacterium]|nr:MAG: serine/threonine protein kinase [Pirellulaceae bacterium]